MRIFILLASFFLSFIITDLSAKVPYTGKEEVVIAGTMETKHCFISYVMIDGIKYLLKQKKDHKKQLSVVRDALSAYIAQTLKGLAHEIAIIEAQREFTGKNKILWPATLHTLAPGETVRKQRDSKYNALRLRQLWSQAPSFAERGLTKMIIEHITWHKQLPEIVALDLFIGNSDRHCGNLCYDPSTDKFCAIDMDDTFNKDLCLFACEKLTSMTEEDKIIFTEKELFALSQMKNTLKILVRAHTPYDMIQKLHYFAAKAGFAPGGLMYDDRSRKRMLHFEKMIRESHASAKLLIVLLEKIIKKQSFNNKLHGTKNALV